MTRVELSRWQRKFVPKKGSRWRWVYPEQATRRRKRKPK